MYTLRLLGPPVLTGPHGPLSGRVSQERKLAVLAVLALSEGRTVTRDTLAGMFWPESEPNRARHNVADAVWVIRKALGTEAVQSRGNHLTLNPLMVAIDVEAFREALDAGDLAAAAGHYTGECMDGFHISGAPDFEHWLDVERIRLSRAHGAALEALVLESLAEGRSADAVEWARSLVATDPLNTRRALLCMQALAEGGDSAGAILHGTEHSRQLEEELGIPAPPEVAERIRELRACPPPVPIARPRSTEGYRPPPGPFGHRGAPGMGERGRPVQRHPEPPNPIGRPRSTPWRAGGVAAAAAILVLVWQVPSRMAEDLPAAVPERIVVLSFQNRTGDPELDLLGRLSAEVLVRGLARAGVGDVILPEDMLGTGVGVQGGPAGPSQARSIAAEAGAGIALSGTIDRDPRGAALTATIMTMPGFRIPAALDPVPFDPANPDEALEELRSRVVGTVAAHLGADLPEHPFVVRTPSWEAYRAADRATRLFLNQRFDSAGVLFRRAWELDQTAWGYLLWEAVAYWNVRNEERVRAILDEVRPRTLELSPFDGAHFDWIEARLAGDLAGAVRASQTAQRLYPHSGLGGFQFGLDLTRVGRLDEALEAYLRLDPDQGWLRGHQFYWSNLATVYRMLGRHADELAVADEGYRRFPGALLLDHRIQALAALGRVDEVRSAIRESPDPSRPVVAATRSLVHHGLTAAAMELAAEGLEALASTPLPSVAPGVRSVRRSREAELLAVVGRLEEAREVVMELLASRPAGPGLLARVGVLEARLGLEDEARDRIAALEVLARDSSRRGEVTESRATIHAALGDEPALVRLLLERSHREGRSLPALQRNPVFAEVRDHPDAQGFFGDPPDRWTAGAGPSSHPGES